MKQNKFLIGLIIVTVLGAGALGFLLFQAKGKYNEAFESYSTKASELSTLQAGKPFPEEANYRKMLDLQEKHQTAINALQRQLASAEIPIKPLRPVEFQDKLKETLDRIRAAAAQQNVALPKDKAFTLGFEKYLSEPPKEEAAAPLGRMLEAMEKATMELIKTAPAEIKAVNRIPLAEEGLPGQRAAATPAPARGSRTAPARAAAPEKPLVQRFPFELQFVAQEPKVRVFLNAMVSNKEQFYIPAAISILNQQTSGPARVAPGTQAGAPPPAPPPDPNVPPDAPADPNAPVDPDAAAATPAPVPVTKFVVGEERLDVLARFEYVDFADVPPEKETAAKDNGGNKAKQPAK